MRIGVPVSFVKVENNPVRKAEGMPFDTCGCVCTPVGATVAIYAQQSTRFLILLFLSAMPYVCYGPIDVKKCSAG